MIGSKIFLIVVWTMSILSYLQFTKNTNIPEIFARQCSDHRPKFLCIFMSALPVPHLFLLPFLGQFNFAPSMDYAPSIPRPRATTRQLCLKFCPNYVSENLLSCSKFYDNGTKFSVQVQRLRGTFVIVCKYFRYLKCKFIL